MRIDLSRSFLVLLSSVVFAFAGPALAQTTVTLMQGQSSYAGTTDSWISCCGAADLNKGAEDLQFRDESGDSMLIRFAIFQSEGGPVPNGATITSATLSIYKPYGPDVVTKASRLLKSWNETQVTWNVAATGSSWTAPGALSAGNDYAATADGQGSVGDADANGCSTTWGADACWLNINVTSGVQAFAGGTPNFGWKLAQVSSSGQFVYKDLISRENANFPTLRPKLTITYTTAPGTTVTLMQGQSSYAGTTDSWISCCGAADLNKGAEDLQFRDESGDSMLIRFAIFQSEGGPVPNGATITSATLSIYKPYGPDVVTKASRLLKSWNETQVTWNVAATGAPWTAPGALSAGNDYVATADGQGSVGDADANGCSTTWGADACWLNINVTSGVQAFAGGTPNFGWKLAQVSSSGQFVYKDLISRENANFPTLRPKLTIAWTSAGVPAAQLTANPTSGQPPLNVTFDASGSTDNGAPITGLHLAFGDGTPDVTWSNKNQTQLHTYNTAETYTATLTATNANGTSAPVTRVITVSTTPIGPTAQFTATPSSGTEPLSVIFSASGSTQGTAQISSLRLQFGYNAQEITWSDKNAPQSFTYPAGDFIATLTVTDSSNLTSSTTRAIHVNPVGIGEVAPGTDPAGSLGFSVPTFHSMSLYYSPASAPSNCTTSVGSGCKVWMRYRKATEPNTAWHEGYPLWFDPRTTDGNSPATNTLPFTATHPETLQVLQYRARGSAVLLQPGTKYFFEFGIGTAFNTATWLHYVAGTTWSETFAQDGDVVTIPNTSGTCPAAGPCVITQGGSATSGYKIYDGWNGTSKNVIDRLGQNTESDIGVDNSHAIVVKADFVIVRRVRARGAATAAIYVAPDVTDVVIEDCDVDDWAWRADGTNGWGTWGRNEAAGIHLGGNNSRIVVQRNVIKAPHLGAFPWDTDRSAIEVPNNHPAGTNGISVWSGGQQNVIRYNEITGDPTNKHKSYQDGIGGAENFSTKGSPGADSDIYQNIIMNVFDDAIEAEGGGRNVRVWGNYINEAKTAVATTTVHFGPTYVWRNVVNHMRVRYYSTNDTDADFPMTAFKFGGWNDVRAGEGYGEGIRYLFHNTLLQEPLGAFPEGAGLGVEDTSNGRQSVSWTIAKNNIFHIRDSNYYSVESGNTPTGSSFSYNVYNGRYTDPDVLSESTPAATYKFSNAGATPELFYKPGHGYSSVPALGGNGTGNYQLEAGSKGLDVGDLIPNFNDGYTGAAPDVGAHENGAPPMRFGITAGQ